MVSELPPEALDVFSLRLAFVCFHVFNERLEPISSCHDYLYSVIQYFQKLRQLWFVEGGFLRQFSNPLRTKQYTRKENVGYTRITILYFLRMMEDTNSFVSLKTYHTPCMIVTRVGG